MGKTFSLADYLRRQAGTLAWRAFALVLFGSIAFAGPALLNNVLAKSEFAKTNADEIKAAETAADEAKKLAEDANTKADAVIRTQSEIVTTQKNLFDELHQQGIGQASLGTSIAVIGEDVKAIQGQLLRDEHNSDRQR